MHLYCSPQSNTRAEIVSLLNGQESSGILRKNSDSLSYYNKLLTQLIFLFQVTLSSWLGSVL